MAGAGELGRRLGTTWQFTKYPPFCFQSGDLAWTASFSSLTSNTGVSSHSTVSSYAVFFTLIWPLWATQVSRRPLRALVELTRLTKLDNVRPEILYKRLVA